MTAADRVRAAYAAIAAADRPEIWITLRPMADALADAEAVDNSAATLPLAGLVAAVKNNIDVAGILTTAACPGFSTTPAATDATAVSRRGRLRNGHFTDSPNWILPYGCKCQNQ